MWFPFRKSASSGQYGPKASQSLLQEAMVLKLPLYIASHSDFHL